MISTLVMWLVWGVAGTFLALASIMAVGCVIYPFYIIFEGIKNKSL